MFHVINLSTGKPLERDGEPIVFETGAQAACEAQYATADTGIKHQPRRIVANVDWRARERQRMQDGTYLPVPECWTESTWFVWAIFSYRKYDPAKGVFVDASGPCRDHFAHPSTAKDGMIAFTEDETKGAQDRQTRMAPGRYLQRYCSELLNPTEIAHYAALYSSHFEDIAVQFATTADDIERVYTNGPSSCMSHEASYYDSSEHPVRVYAGPDLAVAYIETQNAGITARAVCWPARKVYSRIYGDAVRLDKLLTEAGYSSGSLAGARIRRVVCESTGRVIVPYIDGFSRVGDAGGYMVIGRGSAHCCDNTNGLGEDVYTWHCDNCEEGFTDDESANCVNWRRGEQYWCDECTRSFSFFCEGSKAYYSERTHERVDMRNGETWSLSYFEEHGTTCEATDENIPVDDAVVLESGETWSREHFETHGHTCACGKLWDANAIQCDDCERTAEVEHTDDLVSQAETVAA